MARFDGPPEPADNPQRDAVSVSVVIPCFRSSSTLPELVSGLVRELIHFSSYEVILVVDGMSGGTAAMACRLAVETPHTRAVVLRRNYGQHNALVAGIRRARGDVIVTMDDDLQHPPGEVRALVHELDRSECDLVYGIPVEEEHGLMRSLASRVTKRALAASGVSDARIVSAFRAFRGELAAAFDGVDDSFVNVDVVLSWATENVGSVRVAIRRRDAGASGYSTARLLRHAFNMVTGYSETPLRVVTVLGIVSSLIGAVLLAFVLISFATGARAVPGYTSIVSAVAIFSGVQMLSLGIVGEYLGRMHSRSTGRPMFLVANAVGFLARAEAPSGVGAANAEPEAGAGDPRHPDPPPRRGLGTDQPE